MHPLEKILIWLEIDTNFKRLIYVTVAVLSTILIVMYVGIML
jgi:hypothetical protein